MSRHILWYGLWCFGLIVLASMGLRWWTGDRFALVRLIVYFMPWILAALVPGLLLALFSGRWCLAGWLAFPAIVIAAAYAPLFLPRDLPAHERPSLRVMSHNIWFYNTHVDRVAKIIREQNPDIVLLQEVNPSQFKELSNLLGDLFPPDRCVYDRKILQAVFTRYPLLSESSLPKKGQAQKVRIAAPASTVTVFNVHPLRRGGWRDRYTQISHLLDQEILQDQGPVILGGDFNVTEQTELYRRITRYLRNAHEEGGLGFGFTFPSYSYRVSGFIPSFPLVRIDHLFYTSHLQLLSFRTLSESGGSDHLPILADFHLQDQKK